MLERLLASLANGPAGAVYLIHGDLVLAEPAALRLAEAIGERGSVSPEVRRHPPRLTPLLDDLKTYSLFGGGKVVVAIDTAALADRRDAADLIDEAEDALPIDDPSELPSRARPGASRLLQALRLFELSPEGGNPLERIEALPKWVLEGGKKLRQRKPRGRSKVELEALVHGLARLLESARGAGLAGWAEGDLAELAEAVHKGFPEGHTLVLAEREVAADHPVARALAERGAVLAVGTVTGERGGGFSGLDPLAAELTRQTGVQIDRDALAELARRTLRQERDGGVEADSTARFAGEYRKLASLAAQRGRIDRRAVEEAVEDRGQEDVWQLLDAVGAGRAGEALSRLRRYLGSAEDALAARLSLFALLAALCRQIAALRGLMAERGVPVGETQYKRFEMRWATVLAADLADGVKSPLAGLNPFRLFKAYLAACRIPPEEAALLPWRALEAEIGLKGGSDDPDAVLADLLVHLARPR
ncbi:MAG TPA: hypothetical protein VF017_05715 [Thermoanaerobaculia bacterium]|nr:hypothetical protein [Thermoanaerobaculia bacterium]